MVAFPRRVPRCEHCGWLVPPGSATEIAHHERCTAPRQKVEARGRRRQEERIARLRMALCDPETRRAIMAATRLPEAALDRVALGRLTLAATLWRRVLLMLRQPGE